MSAVAIACGMTDIMPTEVSCPKMIDAYTSIDRWQENDGYVPRPGDLIMYDWDDSGSGDATGQPEHVGMVETVSGSAITVIEGNYQNAVMRRTLNVNGRYIRGYCLPNFGEKVTEEAPAEVKKETSIPQLRRGATGATVKAMQILLEGYGFSCGRWGTDGDFGRDTEQAVKKFQAAKGLVSDGICGNLTWGKLLGVTL